MRLPSLLPAALAAVASIAACAPQLVDVRMGVPRAARAPDCDLTVVSATDMATLAKYDQIGVVNLSNAEAGTDPLAPEVRAIVRPRACAMGGEAISVMASGDITARQSFRTTAYAAYLVWARKSAAGAPQKF